MIGYFFTNSGKKGLISLSKLNLLFLILILYNMRFWKKNSYKNYDLQIKNEYLNARISKTIENIYDKKKQIITNKFVIIFILFKLLFKPKE